MSTFKVGVNPSIWQTVEFPYPSEDGERWEPCTIGVRFLTNGDPDAISENCDDTAGVRRILLDNIVEIRDTDATVEELLAVPVILRAMATAFSEVLSGDAARGNSRSSSGGRTGGTAGKTLKMTA